MNDVRQYPSVGESTSSFEGGYSLHQPSNAKKVGFFALGVLALIGGVALGAVLGGSIHESFIDSAKHLSNTLLKGITEMKPWALATLGGVGATALGCGVLAASSLNPTREPTYSYTQETPNPTDLGREPWRGSQQEEDDQYGQQTVYPSTSSSKTMSFEEHSSFFHAESADTVAANNAL